jgi:hypothetical protein
MKKLITLVTFALLAIESNATTLTVSSVASVETEQIGPGFNYKKHHRKSKRVKHKNRKGGLGCPYSYGC